MSWLTYNNQSAIRNKPMSDELMAAFETFIPQSGLRMDVISGGQDAKGEGDRRTGSTRHDHGGAVDADFYDVETGDKLDWNNPAHMDRIAQLVQSAKSAGLGGIGAGNDYMGAGRFHMGTGNPGTWGAGGKSANTPDWLKAAYAGVPLPEGHSHGDGHGHGQQGLGPTRARAEAGLPLNTRSLPEEPEYMDNVIGRLQQKRDEMRAGLGEKLGVNDETMKGAGRGLMELSRIIQSGGFG